MRTYAEAVSALQAFLVGKPFTHDCDPVGDLEWWQHDELGLYITVEPEKYDAVGVLEHIAHFLCWVNANEYGDADAFDVTDLYAVDLFLKMAEPYCRADNILKGEA
jgi:hypothetical protein